MTSMSKYTGTDFDDFLMDEGILEEVIARAHKRLLTLQLDEATKVSNTVRLDDMDLLLRETAAWNAASDEDTLKIEDMLTEKINRVWHVVTTQENQGQVQ